MEFLVETNLKLPDSMTDARRHELFAIERARGFELRRGGVIKRIWRIPGGYHSIAIWEVEDPTSLQKLLLTLPLFQWLNINVTALAAHHLETEES
jgi:muconolactone D-isomerase